MSNAIAASAPKAVPPCKASPPGGSFAIPSSPLQAPPKVQSEEGGTPPSLRQVFLASAGDPASSIPSNAVPIHQGPTAFEPAVGAYIPLHHGPTGGPVAPTVVATPQVHIPAPTHATRGPKLPNKVVPRGSEPPVGNIPGGGAWSEYRPGVATAELPPELVNRSYEVTIDK